MRFMKIVFNIMMILFLLFVAVGLSVSAEDLDKRWKYFATNLGGCNFYYDAGSIIYLPNNVVKVWEKMLCRPETVGFAVEMETLKKIDCEKRTYQEATIKADSPDTNFEPSSRYNEIKPETWMETLYHEVCKKKE